jgi:PAS domain S-box-containing protein
VNRRWAEMLGYDIEEMYGKTVAAVSADDPRFDQAAAMERIQAAVDGTPQQFDWLHERADGSSVWCEVNLKRTRIGGEVRLLAFLRDASHRKEREQELEFLEAMVESVGVGVAAYEADGSFVYVNPNYADMLATDRETLMDATAWEVVPDLDRESFDENWATLDVGETRTRESVHAFADRRVPVETMTTCAAIHGTTYHFGTLSYPRLKPWGSAWTPVLADSSAGE